MSFRPSEIAAAAVLAAVSANQAVDFGSVLSASEIPVNMVSFLLTSAKSDQCTIAIYIDSKCEVCIFHSQEMIARCSELMEQWALVKKRGHITGSSSVPQSPIGVLDAAWFSFSSEEPIIESSQSNISGNNSNQASTQASKRRRLSISPI